MAAVFWVGVAVLPACRPDIEGGASLIDSPRVLAIRSQPAEARPDDPVEWSALFVGPNGDEDPSNLDWALCLERKPLAVAGEISKDCLVRHGKALLDLGSGIDVMDAIPSEACRLFGPNPPVPQPGDPAARAADPDATGGYYQPLRLIGQGGEIPYSVGLTRIDCGIARVTTQQSLDFAKRYRDNENPTIQDVVINPGRAAASLTSSPDTTATVARSKHFTLRTSWPQCPLSAHCGDGICGSGEDRTTCADDCTDPHGCAGSEPYVAFEPAQRQLVDRREAMRVSWYATAGSFDHDRSGRAEQEASLTYSDNGWTAPDQRGTVRVWVVLRDDRGGVGYGSYLIVVK
jgi:hypothetical protein